MPVDPVDEERLVKLVARGDRAAFEELYRRTSPWLAVRLRRRCADDELVAEVMQKPTWRRGGQRPRSLTHVARSPANISLQASIKTFIIDGDQLVAGMSSSSSARTLRSISSRMLRTWSIVLPPGSSSSQSRYRLPG